MTNIRARKSRSFGFFLLSVLVLFSSIIYMTQATTIGGSITVDSALTVGGATTLNGNSTLGDAATDVNLFTGTLQASTTALFTSGLTSYDRIILGLTFSGASSRQSVEADATFSSFTGGYGAAVMGHAMGTVGSGNTINGGLIGKYNITTNSSDHPSGAVLAEIGEEAVGADGAFIAYIGGDAGAVSGGSAFTVRSLNSTSGSGFDYGLDLLTTTIDSYLPLSFGVADIRLLNGDTISNATNGVIDMSGAAVLNRIATSSPTTDTTLTAAQSGTTFFIGTAGVDLTLPAIAGTSGVWYRFVVSAAVADTNQTVIAPTAILNGPIDVNSTLVLCTDEATIAFVQTADTAGDWVEVRSNGTKWFVTGQAQAVGGITCS
ncbi:hypothetical protein A2Z63_01770 [Candidatus Giovannonibacteria bacterium RIFCSPLOWO2_02_44_8]|uniref:Uncharacterized protein n=1 Tax=Candidatus Giovannonibacteria bacterium RIFCSPLOWO2_02_44_8 TaxID=1798355 RepID=A0A1F5XBZ1_9BACT|nr:MAG: hypothetical protein A2Z63_01770 [Candidatus Giovannonibacteria bacterium RIFCSPLOWO2_02_44_8]